VGKMSDRKYAIAYYRKSIRVTGKKEEESIAYQKNKVHDYANRNNLTILNEYSDIGYSGATTERPELQQLLQYVEEKNVKIEELLVYSVDRLGRDLEGNIEVFQKILSHIGKVTFVSNKLSTGYEYFNTFFLLLTAFAEEELKVLHTRLNDGRRSKLLFHKNFDGNYPPLGMIKKNEDKSLVIATQKSTTNSEEIQNTEILKFIFHSYLFNKTLRQIARELNERYGNTRRGKEWTYKSVRYILSNPAYVGILRGTLQKKEHYLIEDANIQPVVDPLVYKAIQLKLQHESTGRKKKVLQRIPYFCLCSFCGGTLIEENSTLSCEKCETSTNKIKELLETAKSAFLQVIYNNINFEIEGIKVIKQYEIKAMKLYYQINQLVERKEVIQKRNNKRIEKMLHLNTSKLNKLLEEQVINNAVITYIKAHSDTQLKEKFLERMKNFLIKIPFVIFIDLVTMQMEVLFHKELFLDKGETVYE
jgi:DNA invertase Pin-like site-specific DNA recombinase